MESRQYLIGSIKNEEDVSLNSQGNGECLMFSTSNRGLRYKYFAIYFRVTYFIVTISCYPMHVEDNLYLTLFKMKYYPRFGFKQWRMFSRQLNIMDTIMVFNSNFVPLIM